MEILNTYIERVPNTLGVIAAIGFAIFTLVSVIGLVILAETDHTLLCIMCLFLGICCFVLFVLTLSSNLPFTYDEVTHYKIVVNNYYPLSELLQQFEITKVEGQILDCVKRQQPLTQVGIGTSFPAPYTVG